MAEKQVMKLREIYSDRNDLVENAEMIDELVNTTLSILRPTKELSSAKDSRLVFEAVIESEDLKIDIFKNSKLVVNLKHFTSLTPLLSLSKLLIKELN